MSTLPPRPPPSFPPSRGVPLQWLGWLSPPPLSNDHIMRTLSSFLRGGVERRAPHLGVFASACPHPPPPFSSCLRNRRITFPFTASRILAAGYFQGADVSIPFSGADARDDRLLLSPYLPGSRHQLGDATFPSSRVISLNNPALPPFSDPFSA